jgi:hypothetical protein
LIIAHGTWLARDDFARFVYHGAGTAAIDWEAAIGSPAGRPSASATQSPASTNATSAS